MGIGRRALRAGGPRLFLTYAAASLLPLLALGGVLVHASQAEARDRALAQGAAQAAVIAEMAVAPALEGGAAVDLEQGIGTTARARLQRATDLAVFDGSVLELRVRSLGGRVVFSDDGTPDGAVPVPDPAFQRALHGRTAVDVVADASGEPRDVVRVVQPVSADASGRLTAVLELVLPYDAIARDAERQLERTYLRLGLGLSGLYVVLALISWSTTRSLSRHADQRERDALTDGLTGLPNRERFRAETELALFEGGSGAVALLDLDRFKEVNDTLGHHAGDELLRVVAERLRGAVAPDVLVARLGGDEFGLVLPGAEAEDVALAALAGVRAALEVEVVLDGVPVAVEASIGVALYPRDGIALGAVLRVADTAMYDAKRATTGVVVHDPARELQVAPALVVQTEVRHALERDELLLHYQPKVELGTGAVRGVEALVRWQHPERGLIPPAHFLPAVERSGLIEPFTAWVLRRALADRAAWAARGLDWSVAVNVSARNLSSGGFADAVLAALDAAGAEPGHLVVEVTETALAADAERARQALLALAAHGVGLAVDDFGTGYTSLQQLPSIPVTELKIAREFVRGLGRPGDERAIVRALVDLAHGLGSEVTAEGVETEDVAAWLRATGCDLAQGYLFARPAPWQDLLATPAAARPTPSGTALALAGAVPTPRPGGPLP